MTSLSHVAPDHDLPDGILIEAEEFDDYGGWVMDSQFDEEMGSPYLLAHGLGRPVADATTSVDIPETGTYRLWVRAKDWVPGHHPGRFALSIDETRVSHEFGADDDGWSWEDAGTVDLRAGRVGLALHDLTGFDGRCDAIFLARSDTAPPNGIDADSRAWRRELRGLPTEPVDVGQFDVVVLGGGLTGSVAALTAARRGLRTALVHNRPVLGGNASTEIGLSPRGLRNTLVNEVAERGTGGDLAAFDLLLAEPNAHVFLEHSVFDAQLDGRRVVSVDAREARTGRELRFGAQTFIDCTGRALLALLGGARTMFGQESQAEYGESLAPTERIETHHGNTVFFRTRLAEGPVDFPEVPWATDVSGDFASLTGQLVRPGQDNGDGPIAGADRNPDPGTRRRMHVPATHFWEYGQELDPYTNGEHVRDHLLRAIYGTYSTVRSTEPHTWANLEFEWVAFVPGQGEFKRYLGDYVLTETDVREHAEFVDRAALNSGAFCLHYPGHDTHDFRLRDWKWDVRDEKPFFVPFRSLYSADLDNVMMAGKHISATHVAGSVVKFMSNGGQHAAATAIAAELCAKYQITPRQITQHHMTELQSKLSRLAEWDELADAVLPEPT